MRMLGNRSAKVCSFFRVNRNRVRGRHVEMRELQYKIENLINLQ